MKKLIVSLTTLLTMATALAQENGGPVFLYDYVGNGLTSTSGALNVSFGASTFAVTQSTTPWITKDLADGSVSGGTAGTFSLLGGGIFNTSLPTLTNGQQAAFQFNSSAELLTVAAQLGVWTVQPGNTPNTTPWLFTINQGGNSATVSAAGALKVDGSAVTQPVSGTVTANIGTTGGLALDTSVTGLQVSQGSTTAGEKGGLTLGAVTTAAPTYTTGQSSPLSLTTAGAIRVDASGSTQPVSGTVTAIPADGVKAAYTAVVKTVASASAATDLFTISGSATKIIRIRDFVLFGGQTVGSLVPINIIKRSTANTGGTSTTGTAIPFSSSDAAATAVVTAYTANPTTGTSLGNLSYETPFVANLQDQLFEYNFNLVPYQVYTLNSAAESIAINLAGATLTGGSFSLKMTWTEE